jgi:hypothetical protein
MASLTERELTAMVNIAGIECQTCKGAMYVTALIRNETLSGNCGSCFNRDGLSTGRLFPELVQECPLDECTMDTRCECKGTGWVPVIPLAGLRLLLLSNHLKWILAPSEKTTVATICWDGIVVTADSHLLAIEQAILTWGKVGI